MMGSSGSMAPNAFDNVGHIKNVTCPVLCVHGLEDRIIGAEHSKALFQAATRSSHRVLQLIPNVGHNDMDDEEHLYTPMSRFLNTCHKPQRCDYNVGIANTYRIRPQPQHNNTTTCSTSSCSIL